MNGPATWHQAAGPSPSEGVVDADLQRLDLVPRGHRDRRVANAEGAAVLVVDLDRKSTRLNSSHQIISYAVFCLKKKKIQARAFRATHQRPEKHITESDELHSALSGLFAKSTWQLCK